MTVEKHTYPEQSIVLDLNVSVHCRDSHTIHNSNDDDAENDIDIYNKNINSNNNANSGKKKNTERRILHIDDYLPHLERERENNKAKEKVQGQNQDNMLTMTMPTAMTNIGRDSDQESYIIDMEKSNNYINNKSSSKSTNNPNIPAVTTTSSLRDFVRSCLDHNRILLSSSYSPDTYKPEDPRKGVRKKFFDNYNDGEEDDSKIVEINEKETFKTQLQIQTHTNANVNSNVPPINYLSTEFDNEINHFLLYEEGDYKYDFGRKTVTSQVNSHTPHRDMFQDIVYKHSPSPEPRPSLPLNPLLTPIHHSLY